MCILFILCVRHVLMLEYSRKFYAVHANQIIHQLLEITGWSVFAYFVVIDRLRGLLRSLIPGLKRL